MTKLADVPLKVTTYFATFLANTPLVVPVEMSPASAYPVGGLARLTNNLAPLSILNVLPGPLNVPDTITLLEMLTRPVNVELPVTVTSPVTSSPALAVRNPSKSTSPVVNVRSFGRSTVSPLKVIVSAAALPRTVLPLTVNVLPTVTLVTVVLPVTTNVFDIAVGLVKANPLESDIVPMLAPATAIPMLSVPAL